MTLISVNNSHLREDGLYAGEEVCAIFSNNDWQHQQQQYFPSASSELTTIDENEMCIEITLNETENNDTTTTNSNNSKMNDKCETAPTTNCTNVSNPTKTSSPITNNATPCSTIINSRRGCNGNRKILVNKLLTKATSRFRVFRHRRTPSSSNLQDKKNQDYLYKPKNNYRNDDDDDESTCDLSCITSWSSISQSTCDFDDTFSLGSNFFPVEETSVDTDNVTSTNSAVATKANSSSSISRPLPALARSQLNPWNAAKRGDYATLLRIEKQHSTHHHNGAIWTSTDTHGNVPLVYACTQGGSYGKYGFESVKLLLHVWPGNIPRELLKRCKKHAVTKDVSKLLALELSSLSPKSKLNDEQNKCNLHEPYGLLHVENNCANNIGDNDNDVSDSADDVLFEGLSFVRSDIGDDGFDEDY